MLKRCLVLLARAGILTGWSGVARASFCQNVGQIRVSLIIGLLGQFQNQFGYKWTTRVGTYVLYRAIDSRRRSQITDHGQ